MVFISLEFGQVNKIIQKLERVFVSEHTCNHNIKSAFHQAETSTASDHGQLRTKVPSRISFGSPQWLSVKFENKAECRKTCTWFWSSPPSANGPSNKSAKKLKIYSSEAEQRSKEAKNHASLLSILLFLDLGSPVSKYISKSYGKLRVVSVLFLETPKGLK